MMYSLYRAWLSLGPSLPSVPSLPPMAPLNLSASPMQSAPGAPDVTLQVGPGMIHFSAHRSVLSAHSGYFKAALANCTDPPTISVPNVNVDEFSSLLTFMYTGYLDLNIRNIYNILLATHILHMPSALEICRTFLLQSHPTMEVSPTTIIKPIPSRKSMFPLSQPIYTPNFSNILPKSHDTPFKIVTHAKPTKPDEENTKIKASTSQNTEIEVSDVPKVQKVKPTTTDNKTKRKKSESGSNDQVIIDIACCDGPVRFHRVINKNYGCQTKTDNPREVSDMSKNAAMNKVMSESIKAADENQMTNNDNEVFTCLYCNHTFKSQYCYQKHARRHLNPVSIENKLMTKETTSAKREVKLLDMNVQYYPCKTCGSKFPSYYFVHKHRKMCHAEEVEADKDNEAEKSEVAVDETNSNSAIDVETVNSDQNV